MGRPPETAVTHRAGSYNASDLDRPAGDRWVTMSNALTRAGHGLTLAEKRMIIAAVSKLDSYRPITPGEIPRTKVTAAEYAALAGCAMPTAYQALQGAAENLYKRSITFYTPSYRRGSKKLTDRGMTTRMRWVGEAKYQDKEGWVELAWWPPLLPHLLNLKKQFTSYQLQQASALRSIYTWKLLELLTRFEETGWAEYTVEDFATSMDATDKHRADFGKLRTKIIEPAVKELQEKDGWQIEWSASKAGRRVAKLRFAFRRDPQDRLQV